MTWEKNAIIIIISAILIATSSWAVYRIINQGAGDLLNLFGITNIYYQSFIVIVFAIAILLLIGVGFSKTFKKILKID